MSSVAIWGDSIAIETLHDIPFRMYTQRPRRVESLLDFTDRWGARPHIIQGDRIVTFSEMRTMVTAKARTLAELGVARGDRVFILGWNGPEWIVNFWACLELAAIPVLANAWWSEAELKGAIDALQPALTLADKHGAARLPAGNRRGPWELDISAGVLPSTQNVPMHEEEPAVIIFTSGTEGKPKAVVLSHRALLAGLQMLLHITRRLPHQISEATGETGLHTGPLFHVGGVQTLIRAITVGDTLVMLRGKFDPADALELIERHQITRWAAVPTMVSRLLEHPDVQTRDVRSLRSLTVGGAPVHAELLKRIPIGFPGVNARIPTGYGLTENGGQATAASGADTAQRPGSAGRPLPLVEIKFVPRTGLPDGEIYLRAPTQMSGYYGTSESPIDARGWLHTGDLGRMDDGAHLWITGRCKDMIIRGGENIAPVAVERALLSIPGVSEAVVFGVPHPDLGEEVMAIVVVEGDHTVQSIQQALKGNVASFSVPSRWQVQKEPLPTNHAGKVDKAGLSARVRAELSPQ